MKYVNFTDEHLRSVQQYIYNITCEFEGTMCAQLPETLFSRRDIEQCITNGVLHYEDLLQHKRTIVEECKHRTYMSYDDKLYYLGHRQHMSTAQNEQALRILLHFNNEDNVYKCSYLDANLQHKTIAVPYELIEDDVHNLLTCEPFEVELYKQVLNVQEHVRALIFFHALGMHMSYVRK